jgi:hypothetical protein
MPFKQEHHWDFVGEIYTRYLLLSYKPELSDTLDNSLKNSESEHVVVVIPGVPLF